MAAKDTCVIGDTYGLLTIIGRDFSTEEDKVANGKQRRAYYHCQCSCGKEVIAQGFNLVKGITASCGCLKKRSKRKSIKNLTGQVFGDYVVDSIDEMATIGKGKHRKWMCRCQKCGSAKSFRGADLRCGKSDFICKCDDKGSLHPNAVNMLGKTFGHLKVIDIDISDSAKRGSGEHIRWLCICDICGKTESIDGSHLRTMLKDRCRNCCKKSVGEAKVADILTANGISFLRDRPNGECRNDKTGHYLRFDFQIIDSSYGSYIIEYDGMQHFKVAPMWDNNGDLEERQRLDKLKNTHCRNNGIPLIRIPYTKLRTLCLEDLLPEQTKYLVI